jgi:hypothetical protein
LGSSKKYLILLLKLAISGTLLYLVLRKAGLENVFSAIGKINPVAFVSAMGLYLAAQLVSTFRWRLMIPSRPALKRLYSLYLVGSFFSTIMPGLIGGDAVKGYYLYKETGKMPEAMASIFMERYLGLAAMLAVGAAAYPLGMSTLRGTPLFWAVPVMVGAGIVASVFFFRLRLGKGIKFVGEFYGYLSFYDRGVISRGVLYSFGVQMIGIVMVYTISRGLGMDVPLRLFFIFVPITVALSALPLSISGLGIREASFVILFGPAGVGPEAATALSFTWYLCMAAASLSGLYIYLRMRKN